MELPLLRDHQQNLCFDKDAPFEGLTHAGKLEPELGGQRTAPRVHCVVNTPDGTQALLRFTPHEAEAGDYKADLYTELMFPDVDTVVTTHTKHLARLGELGILQLETTVAEGIVAELGAGTFVLTELLPEGSRRISTRNPADMERLDAMQQTFREAYVAWAREQEEPRYLRDTVRLPQHSVLPDGSLTLHDVEPRYEWLE